MRPIFLCPIHVHRNPILTFVHRRSSAPHVDKPHREIPRPIQAVWLPPKNIRQRPAPPIPATKVTRLCNHPTTGKYIACTPLDMVVFLRQAAPSSWQEQHMRHAPCAMLLACTTFMQVVLVLVPLVAHF